MAFAALSTPCQVLRGATGIFTSQSASLLSRAPALCACILNRRKMTSPRQTDHLERTANTFRQEIISPAKVCGITNESTTVKRVRLAVENSEFTFKAGQWVDFFIPGIPKVGGFSICSSPGLLEREGILELAVKYNLHPPAHWVHTQCSLNSEVALRVGGEFFFDPQLTDSPVDLVLIAGGVGINPLFSILLHVADLHKTLETTGRGFRMGNVKLYYCAKNTNELLFKPVATLNHPLNGNLDVQIIVRFLQLCSHLCSVQGISQHNGVLQLQKNILNLMHNFPGKIVCSFHVTQQSTPICPELQPFITEGRITKNHLANSVTRDNLCYICGPPPMIEAMCQQLEDLQVPREQIYFEKWW